MNSTLPGVLLKDLTRKVGTMSLVGKLSTIAVSTLFGSIIIMTISSTAKAGPSNEEIKIGLSQEFDSLHPMIATMNASNYLYSLVGRSLMVIDAKGKWVPQLAEKIPSFENGLGKIIDDEGKKVTQATWQIHEKAKWSDGTPLTCADFKLALEIANSDSVAVAGKEDYGAVKKVEWNEKTPKKCVFTYKAARWDFYQIPRFLPVPNHLERPIFEKYGKQLGAYDKNTLYSSAPTTEGLYNGPYKVAEVKPGSHVVFVVNPFFFGPAPKIKRIVARVMADTNSLENAFLSGAVDVISPIGIGFDQALRLDKKINSEGLPYILHFQPALTFEHVDVNLDNPILKDKNVRKALMYGLNRSEMVKAFFENRQKVAHHPIAPIDAWYTDNPKEITIYEFNKQQAEALLDKAGWKLKKEDGFRYKNGERFSVQLMTTAGNKIRETVQTYMQKQWRDLGLEIVIKNEPPRVFFAETVKKRKFTGLAMYAWTVFPEKSPSAYSTASIPTEANGWTGRNTMGWSNKQNDKVIAQIEVEMDPIKRKQEAHQFQKISSEELPVLPLFNRADVALSPKSLKNYRLSGHMFYETNQAEDWEVK